MTKKRLAEEAKITVRTLSAYENDQQSEHRPPSAPTRERIAAALELPVTFLCREEPYAIGEAPFRSLSRTTSTMRRSAIARGVVACDFLAWIAEDFVLPTLDLPPEVSPVPEVAAEQVRFHWKLGHGPIGSMVRLLESKGVRVLSLGGMPREVDALAFRFDGSPVIMLNPMFSAERKRFDLAHELGHILLHEHGDRKGMDIEREANDFASALLMPKKSILAAAPSVINLQTVYSMKLTWRVSAVAMTHRLSRLGVISRGRYATISKQISMAGGRRQESFPIAHEPSILLREVVADLARRGIGRGVIAESLGVNPDDVRSLLAGLVPVAVM